MNRKVRAAPASTTNMTGLRHCTSGLSITNASRSAGRTSSGANNACARDRRGGTDSGGGTLGSEVCVVFSASIAALLHPSDNSWSLHHRRLPAEGHWSEMIGQRSKRGDRQKQQRAENHDRAKQQKVEGHRVIAHGSQPVRRLLFIPRNAAIAIGATIGK